MSYQSFDRDGYRVKISKTTDYFYPYHYEVENLAHQRGVGWGRGKTYEEIYNRANELVEQSLTVYTKQCKQCGCDITFDDAGYCESCHTARAQAYLDDMAERASEQYSRERLARYYGYNL
jgi:hypothetical protein